jgi:hypothetical protein
VTAYRKNLLTWACVIAVELTIGALGIYLSKWFFLPFFLLIYAIPFVLRGIVCPKCGTPVTYQGTLAGFRIQGGFIRRTCQQCGWDLDKNL